MPTGLDVWIAKQGSACKVDSQAWNVTVYDAHNQVFEWAGVVYANLPAPHAHWAGSIPPGTYVVRAVRADNTLTTDHAIVTVECVEVSCVRLFVAPSAEGKRPNRPVDGRCKIVISEVVGIGQSTVSLVQVTGTALKCKKVRVAISCDTDESRKEEVSVSSSGEWVVNLKVEGLRCKCGKRVVVIARCVEDPECVAKFETDKLRCKSPDQPNIPK